MTTIINRARHWLPFAALLLVTAAAVLQTGTSARSNVIVQAAMYVVFAVVVPALLAVGWPARQPASHVYRLTKRYTNADQPGIQVAASLVPFIVVAIAWRLPAAVSALTRYPALTVAELVTLAGAGTVVWLDLAPGLVARHPLPPPLRAGMAAVAMWTIWAVAYVAGMSGAAGVPGAAGGVATSADARQLAVAVLWAVPAICFVPVVYGALMRWLSDRARQSPDAASSGPRGHERTTVDYVPRAPRGWRS